MTRDVAVILPCIRPQNLVKVYNSIQEACKGYSFEVLIPSPYTIPDEILKKENVKYFHTYTSPTIACQMAIQLANARFLYNMTDDGLVQNQAISLAIQLHQQHSLTNKDVINMIYREAVLNCDTLEIENVSQIDAFPSYYWLAVAHEVMRLPGISPNWRIALHFFMDTDYFLQLGGYDCRYETLNHAIHDLMFRVQTDGGRLADLPVPAFYCSHIPGTHRDHKPIVDGQMGPDLTLFNSVYSKPNPIEQVNIKYNNWKHHPTVWERRFDKNNLSLLPLTY